MTKNETKGGSTRHSVTEAGDERFPFQTYSVTGRKEVHWSMQPRNKRDDTICSHKKYKTVIVS